MEMPDVEDIALLPPVTATDIITSTVEYTPWTGVLKEFEYGLSHDKISLKISLPEIPLLMGGHWYDSFKFN